MHCDACGNDVHPFQDLVLPSMKLMDKCPTAGCGNTFGFHDDDGHAVAAQPVEATPAPSPVATQQVTPASSLVISGGTQSLIAALELRLAELELEASTIRRMLRAASEAH